MSKPTEAKIQAECFQWAWNQRPQTRYFMFHVPNGSTSMQKRIKDRSMGVVAGIPDIIFLWMGKVYGIEMKRPGGKQSKEQINIEGMWKREGYNYVVIDNVDDFKHYIDSVINNEILT